MKQQIVLTISLKGDTKIEVIGSRGPSCTADTKPLEEALGAVTDRKLKPEYHQVPAVAGQQVKR